MKKIISINESVYPFTKKNISEELTKIYKRVGSLGDVSVTILELQEIYWLLNKYSLENNKESQIYGQYEVIEEKIKVRLFPILGYKFAGIGKNTGYSRKIGAHVDAYFGTNLGIMFEYLDLGQFGDNVDKIKQNTSERGYFINYKSRHGIEFSDVRGQLNYEWDWGVLSLKKDYNKWGHGRYGQLILSDKTASYPQIHLRFNPVDWITINYLHGWLNSMVKDSSKSFIYSQSDIKPKLNEEYLPKFITANYISLNPSKWFTFSFGNSFVYSGELRPEMFIPIMYYKAMDHNTGRGNIGDGNGILYFDIGIKYPSNCLFYATLIADVINIRDMIDGKWYKQWFGYTVGGSVVDLGINNSEFRIEYTKTNPWIYENKYEPTNYKHINFSLGHWIGQNADLLTAEYNYSCIRGLYISLFWQLFRKGDMLDIYFAYEDQVDLTFLYGEQRTEQKIQLSVDYELMNNIYFQGTYCYSDIKDEKMERTQDFLIGNNHSFSLAISYGFPF